MEKVKKPKFSRTVIGVSIILVVMFIGRVLIERYFRYESHYGAGFPKSEFINPEMILRLGQAAEKTNRYEEALSIYAIGNQYFPSNQQLLFKQAAAYEALGEKQEAVEILNRIAFLFFQDAKTQVKISNWFFKLSEFNKSFEIMQRAVELDPSNEGYLYRYAQLADLNADYSLAHELFQKLYEKHPKNKAYAFALVKTENWASEQQGKDAQKLFMSEIVLNYEKNNPRVVEDLYEKFLLLFGPTQSIQQLLAEQTYLNMLKANPRDSETYFRMAQFYYRYNVPEKALKSINKAIEVKAKNLEYQQLKGKIATQLGSNEQRKEAYEAILTILPQDQYAFDQLVIIDITGKMSVTPTQIESDPLLLKIAAQTYLGDVLGAFKTLEEYGRKEAQNPLFQAFLAYLASQLDRCLLGQIHDHNKLSELVKTFTLISNLQRNDSMTLQDRANLMTKKMIVDNPCSIEALKLHALVLRTYENVPPVDFVAAQQTYCRILYLNPFDREAYRNLARMTALSGEIDKAACLYNRYVHLYPPEKLVLVEFADVLQGQGNIGLALCYLNLYEMFYGTDDFLKERKAQVLNSGELSTCAMSLSKQLLEKEPENYNAWVSYTNAAAILNCPYQSLYGFDHVYAMHPGYPATKGVEWTVFPDLMHYLKLSGQFYQESTSLTEYFENLEGSYTVRPDLKIQFGSEAFQTYSSTTFSLVLGLGNLRGINGEAWGSESSAWVGFNKIIDSSLAVNLRVGGANQRVGNIYSWTPIYQLNLFNSVCDILKIDLYSSYGFLLISPRSLSLKIRQWKNMLTIDWTPQWGCKLLTIFNGRINTDGNKQFESFLYPRKTILYRKHWKADVGLVGRWLTSHKSRDTGYYQPHFFQAYGGQALLDYRIDYYNEIHIEGTLGIQKDTFSYRFGFLGDLQASGLFNITFNWYLNLFSEYYYVDTSNGYFSFVNLGGGLTYRW